MHGKYWKFRLFKSIFPGMRLNKALRGFVLNFVDYAQSRSTVYYHYFFLIGAV